MKYKIGDYVVILPLDDNDDGMTIDEGKRGKVMEIGEDKIRIETSHTKIKFGTGKTSGWLVKEDEIIKSYEEGEL